MTPTQFKDARKSLGLSQNAMAEAIGLKTSRAIRQYESGEREVSGPVAKLVSIIMRSEIAAVRYEFDGFGWKYIDSGSGSDWRTRHPDAEPLYDNHQPDSAMRNTVIEECAAIAESLKCSIHNSDAERERCYEYGVKITSFIRSLQRNEK